MTIPDSVTSIGRYAFSGCSGLANLTIPDSVTSIGDDAFSDCSGLLNVKIPNGVTSIGQYAFLNCGSLKRVEIPDSVKIIGRGAFMRCEIKNIYYAGNAAKWKAIGINSGNEALTAAKIHYNSTTPEPIPLTTIYVTKAETDTSWQFNVTVGKTYPDSFVYAVIYDENGNISSIDLVPLNTSGSTAVSADKSETDKTAKIFVWTDDIQPITKGESIELN